LGTLFAQILLNLFRKAELSRIAMENRFVEKATGAISDKYRLAILLELSNKGSMTSSDIQELTGLSQGRNLHLTLNKESLQQLSGFIEKLT
jgi:ArsR family transcriptional regulator